MNMVEIIKKKRDGLALTKEEIRFFVDGYTKGIIPDYQASALTMAIFFSKMTPEETYELTMAMRDSGDHLDLSSIPGIKVDKHSTGGVGDKTSLCLAPMVVACGAKVAKMSGRGLGHTGGTIDKLETFKGFNVQISNEEFINNVNTIGMSIMGQTLHLAPADKKLYALRDVTATVENMSLIASSIMSKKLASGANALCLDVKCGSGAFMKTQEDATELAKAMVSIGKMAGVNCVAVISNMDQPLGLNVGNSLEVLEAIETLKGNGPQDFTQLLLELGSEMLLLSKITDNKEEAKALLLDSIKSGSALKKLAEFVEAQGGDASPIYDTSLLPIAPCKYEVKSNASGYITHINCEEIGMCSMLLGGGRMEKDQEIDLSVGVVLNKKCGDYVNAGETIAVIYAQNEESAHNISKRLLSAYTIGEKAENKNIILDICR